MALIVVKAPLNRALGLRHERYEVDLDCSATPRDIVATLKSIEKTALLDDLSQLVFLSNGKVLDPEKSLKSQISCSDGAEVMLLPSLEGGLGSPRSAESAVHAGLGEAPQAP
ncbi:MAG: hypothetical protein ABWW70_00045 [Thermoproteota archaeon]